MADDTFRKEYTPLNDEQKVEMQNIKTKAEVLEALYSDSLNKSPEGQSQEAPRLIAMAKSYLEISVLLAIKAVTAERK